jgi:hypothetical protein
MCRISQLCLVSANSCYDSQGLVKERSSSVTLSTAAIFLGCHKAASEHSSSVSNLWNAAIGIYNMLVAVYGNKYVSHTCLQTSYGLKDRDRDVRSMMMMIQEAGSSKSRNSCKIL